MDRQQILEEMLQDLLKRRAALKKEIGDKVEFNVNQYGSKSIDPAVKLYLEMGREVFRIIQKIENRPKEDRFGDLVKK